MNYQGFLNNQVNLYEFFFFLGCKFKLKFELPELQITEFRTNQVLLYVVIESQINSWSLESPGM
jgi:hypothetical protein